jgi:hypothetical protein
MEEVDNPAVVAVNNNNGSSGLLLLGSNGLHGIYHLALIHPTIGVGPIMLHNLNKVEFLDQDLSKLLLMSTHLAQLILRMLFTLSTLLSRTQLGIWTPEPLLT